MRLFIILNIMILVFSSLVFLNLGANHLPGINTLLIEELAGVMS